MQGLLFEQGFHEVTCCDVLRISRRGGGVLGIAVLSDCYKDEEEDKIYWVGRTVMLLVPFQTGVWDGGGEDHPNPEKTNGGYAISDLTVNLGCFSHPKNISCVVFQNSILIDRGGVCSRTPPQPNQIFLLLILTLLFSRRIKPMLSIWRAPASRSGSTMIRKLMVGV